MSFIMRRKSWALGVIHPAEAQLLQWESGEVSEAGCRHLGWRSRNASCSPDFTSVCVALLPSSCGFVGQLWESQKAQVHTSLQQAISKFLLRRAASGIVTTGKGSAAGRVSSATANQLRNLLAGEVKHSRPRSVKTTLVSSSRQTVSSLLLLGAWYLLTLRPLPFATRVL